MVEDSLSLLLGALDPAAKRWMNPEHVQITPGGAVIPGPGLTPAPAGGGTPIGNTAGGLGTAEAIDKTGKAATEAAGVLTGAEFWHRMLLDVEVYGFLFLLIGIGLYGMLAPQMTAIVQTARKAV